MSGKCNRLLTWLLSPLLPYRLTMAVPLSLFSCVFGHMRRRHSSHDSASPGAEASVKAARFCAPRSGRSALTDARSGGYFATGAPTARVRVALAMFSQPFSLQPFKDFFVTDVGGSGSLLRKRAIVRCAALRGFSLRLTNQIQATKS